MLKPLNPYLYKFDPKPFFDTFTHSYLIKTSLGNVLIDPSDELPAYHNHLLKLGALRAILFTHNHKTISKETVQYIQKNFQVSFWREGDLIPSFLQTISLKIIPFPGHTKDSVLFKWTDPSSCEHLFSGDSFYLDGSTLSKTLKFSDAKLILLINY